MSRPAPGVSRKEHAESTEIVLDVRTREEFTAAHVPHAKNLPVQELRERHDELGAKTTRIVIYCRSGARSAIAAGLLKTLGFTNVIDIGAMSNWRAR
jgi:rhodanese-related sulfurtransferase